MAIVKMNKFTLLTFHEHKQALLRQLQVFGDVHLKSPDADEVADMDFLRSDFSQEQLTRYEVELEKVRFATTKLAPFVEKPKLGAKRPTLTFEEFDSFTAEYDYDAIYSQIKQQDDAISAFKAEIARRAAENEALSAWRKLDISPAELDALQTTGYLIGTVNKQTVEEFTARVMAEFDAVYVEQLDTIREDTAFLLLFPAEQLEDLHGFVRELGFTRTTFAFRGMPRVVMEDNRTAIAELKKKQEQAVQAIAALAEHHQQMQIALDYFSTVLEREKASRHFLASDTVLLIEGWVPTEDSERLHSILQSVCGNEYFLQEQAVEKDSQEVPIKLKNNKFVSAFESITEMYSLPRYNELDPTPLLTPFYWLFFGMMVGDIGYGLVLFLGTTFALHFLDLKESMRNFMRFFRFLSISIILMGFVYGGMFGVTVFAPLPDPNNSGGFKPILDSQADIELMLVISIIIGIVHIVVGLLIKAYMGFRDGDIAAGLFDGLLWIVTVLSGIGWLLAIVGVLGGPLGASCKWIFFAGLVGLAATQGRGNPTIVGKIGGGLWDGVYGISGYVGDIVSYTRLVALALSGSYIAYAFNLMMGLVAGDFNAGPVVVSVIRLLFGIVIVVFGQALNFGLALLGGYVHTCRLQYVEFFGKFYEGGGVVFRPLALKNQYVHIKK